MSDKQKTTLSDDGSQILVSQDDVDYPASYSFDCINDYVHSPLTGYEDLQSLCLGMATEMERLNKKSTEAG